MEGAAGEFCLVTGGAGFIGCAISEGLATRFRRVVAVDILHPQIHAARVRPAALHPDVELVVDDVTDAGAWDRLLSSFRPDVVVHLAAETGTGQSLAESDRHGRVNVCGTTAMLDGLLRAHVVPRRVIMASSRAVYGEGAWSGIEGTDVYPRTRTREMLARGEWDFPRLSALPSSAERTWPYPCNVYGATKLAQEHILSAWCVAFGAELSALRLQNVYGPGQSLTNSYTGIVSLFCRLARDGREIPVYEDGAMLRDFILIDDVAAALLAAIDGPALAGPLDIGTGCATPIGDVARAIAAHYGAPVPRITGQYRFGDVRHAACDVAPALSGLRGWKPRVPLEDGLRRLILWIETRFRDAAA